nr:hypothetical protein CFP56_22063 [Quercus suber]
MSSAAKWGKRPFIRCIPFEATIDNLQLHFSQFGHALDLYLPMVKVVGLHLGWVVDLYIPRDKETDKPKGFAFAEYESAEVANYAVQLFSGLVSLYNRTQDYIAHHSNP